MWHIKDCGKCPQDLINYLLGENLYQNAEETVSQNSWVPSKEEIVCEISFKMWLGMSGLLFRKAFKGSRVSLCLFPSSQLPAPSLHGSLFIFSQLPNNLSLSDASEFHTMSLSLQLSEKHTHLSSIYWAPVISRTCAPPLYICLIFK